tara:strand:+ start:104 stop:334 length:231 start_codon:yes stop_codon:yes gene_type:complete
MTYTITQKNKRPAGDWIVVGANSEGKTQVFNFAYDPTDDQFNTKAVESEATIKAEEEEIAAKEAQEAAELAEQEAM